MTEGAITVPKVGLTVESVEVLAWLKAPGDVVVAGETVVEVSADKADLEIAAPTDGVLAEIIVGDGGTAAPGDLLGSVVAPGSQVSPAGGEEPRARAGAPAAAAAPEPALDAPATAAPGTVEPAKPAAPAAPVAPEGSNGGRLRVTPLARRVAAELGIDLAALAGSGPRGRIVKGDVERAAAAGPPAPAPARPPATVPAASPSAPPESGGELQEVRWTAARRATARLMEESARTVAPVTLHRRAAAGRAQRTIAALKADGLPATFTHAILAAAARALVENPALNAIWRDGKVMRSSRTDIALAVDVGGDLLAAPVADAASLDTVALVAAASAAVARVRRREPITADPARPATFSVSNLGMFGVEQFTPIITPPQIAVLGVGSVVDGRCHLSLTFDHRAVDGAPAARFLATLADRLEEFDGS